MLFRSDGPAARSRRAARDGTAPGARARTTGERVLVTVRSRRAGPGDRRGAARARCRAGGAGGCREYGNPSRIRQRLLGTRDRPDTCRRMGAGDRGMRSLSRDDAGDGGVACLRGVDPSYVGQRTPGAGRHGACGDDRGRGGGAGPTPGHARVPVRRQRASCPGAHRQGRRTSRRRGRGDPRRGGAAHRRDRRTAPPPDVHLARADLARVAGNEATRRRELSEAHRLFIEMGATARAEQVAQELTA